MLDKTEGAVGTLFSRASKRAPAWFVDTINKKSLYGRPNPDPIQMLVMSGFLGSWLGISRGDSF